MQCFILIGDEGDQAIYLNSYIKDSKIKPFNILRFEKKVKIADVKQIIKNLSIKSDYKEKKLVILPSEITIDAQNALLKTLEELPEFVEIFILSDSKEKLLPTITSRCKVINLERNHSPEIPAVDAQKLESFLYANNLSSQLLFSQEVKDLDNVIIALRNSLILKIQNNDSENNNNLYPIYSFLEKISEYYPYIASNNLNLKFTLEHLLLNKYP